MASRNPAPRGVPLPPGAALGLGLAVAVGAAAPATAAAVTERVSVASGGAQANDTSFRPAISGGGRFVAFDSQATNLVPGDTNGQLDVFVRDRATGTTLRASVGPGGAEGNAGSGAPALSGGGRFVAFSSLASNLVPGDTNGAGDVFVRDLETGTTVRVSVGAGGAQADRGSSEPVISADGQVVAFGSEATNLVPGDTNGVPDVFVRDLAAGTTRRVSVGSGGAQAAGFSFQPALSADGRTVAFTSLAANLVPGDTNGTFDVFVRGLSPGGATRRASLGQRGAQGRRGSGDPSFSADGRLVAFASASPNLVPGDTNTDSDVFVRDLRSGTTRRVSLGRGGAQVEGGAGGSAISADGRSVAFVSSAAGFAPGDSNRTLDVFVRDLAAGTTRRASVGPEGVGGDRASYALPAISADGSVVAFESEATNLVRGDTNGSRDVFVRTR